jgi:hypothetical protein
VHRYSTRPCKKVNTIIINAAIFRNLCSFLTASRQYDIINSKEVKTTWPLAYIDRQHKSQSFKDIYFISRVIVINTEKGNPFKFQRGAG